MFSMLPLSSVKSAYQIVSNMFGLCMTASPDYWETVPGYQRDDELTEIVVVPCRPTDVDYSVITRNRQIWNEFSPMNSELSLVNLEHYSEDLIDSSEYE